MLIAFCINSDIVTVFTCIERRLSVTNLSSENNFADVSTECSSRHQGESERSAKTFLFIVMHYQGYTSLEVKGR